MLWYKYCEMTPESWNSEARGDIHCYAQAQKTLHAKIQEQLETVFSMQLVLRLYNEDQQDK
jgi:hypothetical protein